MVRCGIIGFAFGEGVYQALQTAPGAVVVGVANPGQARREKAAAYGLWTTPDYRELLARDDIDAVFICSPNHLHCEQVLAAAAAHKHLFLEKPSALTLEEVDRMAAACEAAGVINFVDYTMRFRVAARTMKQFVEEKRLGELMNCWIMRFRGFGHYAAGHRHQAVVHPEHSGGWCLHHAVHAVDLAVYIGGEVKDVYARFEKSSPEAPSEESVHALMSYRAGGTATVADQVSILRGQWMGVVGSLGAVAFHDGILEIHREEHGPDRRLVERHVISSDDTLGAACRSFIRCLEQGERPVATIRESRRTLEIILALHESAKKGQKVAV